MDILIKFICLFIPFEKTRKKIRSSYKRYVRFKSYLQTQDRIADFLIEKYITPYLNNESPKWEAKPKQDLKTDKIIWQFWGQGINKETPEIILTCLNSIEKFKDEYEIILLNRDNIQDYIDLPDFVYEKLNNNDEFTYTFFSDLLRIYLLSAYGGIWIDATIFLTDNIDKNLLNKDFFMYQRGEKPRDYKFWEMYNSEYFSWHKDFKVKLLNSFIISKKDNKIINALKDILTNYWKNEDKFKHYFLFQILFNELIKLDEFKQYNCEIINDINPHIMQVNIHKKFNKKLWNSIVNKSAVHKLTYFNECKENSIQEYIRNEKIKPYDIEPVRDYKEITFCSMCFNMGGNKISKIKNAQRKYDDFYLKSLHKLATRYKNLVLWCDQETADFISENNLTNIKTKVIKFEELPRYENREKYLTYLKEMKDISFNQGYLLKDLEPEQVVDYLILVLSKINVVKYAKDNNFFNTEYFCWIDAGMHNDVYIRFWQNWDGVIEPTTKAFKCCFMTGYKAINSSLIKLSSYEDIALIKAPFEIPAPVFMFNKNIVDKFYEKYEQAIKFMEYKRLFTTEQSIFSVMLKQGNENLFEFSKTNNYIDVMNLVAKSNNTQKINNDRFTLLIKGLLLFFVKMIIDKSFENYIRQNVIYKPIRLKLILKKIRKFVNNCFFETA